MSLLKNFWPFLVWMVVILYLSFTPLTNWPKVNLFQKLYFDKLVHISMYAILSFLLLRSFFKQQNNQWPRFVFIVSSVLFCAAMGSSIEFLQPVLTMYRQFEWMDMVANTIGAITGYFIFSLAIKKSWLGLSAQRN